MELGCGCGCVGSLCLQAGNNSSGSRNGKTPWFGSYGKSVMNFINTLCLPKRKAPLLADNKQQNITHFTHSPHTSHTHHTYTRIHMASKSRSSQCTGTPDELQQGYDQATQEKEQEAPPVSCFPSFFLLPSCFVLFCFVLFDIFLLACSTLGHATAWCSSWAIQCTRW